MSQRPTRLHRLVESIPWNRFPGSLKFKITVSASFIIFYPCVLKPSHIPFLYGYMHLLPLKTNKEDQLFNWVHHPLPAQQQWLAHHFCLSVLPVLALPKSASRRDWSQVLRQQLPSVHIFVPRCRSFCLCSFSSLPPSFPTPF